MILLGGRESAVGQGVPLPRVGVAKMKVLGQRERVGRDDKSAEPESVQGRECAVGQGVHWPRVRVGRDVSALAQG